MSSVSSICGLSAMFLVLTAAVVSPQAEAGQYVSPPASGPTLLWRRALVKTGLGAAPHESFGAPAILLKDQLIVTGSPAGDITGFYLENGALRWRHQEGIPCDVPALGVERPEGDNLIVAGNRRGEILALTATKGHVVWRTQLMGAMRAAPLVAEGLLIVATEDNQIYAINLDTGAIVWTQGRPAPVGLTLDGHARPLVANGRVVAGFSDGHIAAYSLADGALVWSRHLGERARGFVDADADPTMTPQGIAVAGFSAGLFLLDPETGHTLWTAKIFGVTSLAWFDGALWAARADGEVLNLDARRGEVRWRGQLHGSPVTRLVTNQRALYTTAGRQGLIAWTEQTASRVPESRMAFGAIRTNDVVVTGDTLAVITAEGWLFVWQRRGTESESRIPSSLWHQHSP